MNEHPRIKIDVAKLKLAFAETLRDEYGTPIGKMKPVWDKFWSKLKEKENN